MTDSDDPAVGAHRPPGYDEEDPYEGEDLSTYPDWWHRNVEQFRAHGMRPYRPPRFCDDVLTPPIIDDLSAEFEVEIRFRSVASGTDSNWELWVDGRCVETVERRREAEGYTVYELSSDEFRRRVREAVDQE